jgi:hypothetical protein
MINIPFDNVSSTILMSSLFGNNLADGESIQENQNGMFSHDVIHFSARKVSLATVRFKHDNPSIKSLFVNVESFVLAWSIS